jgi:enoyl-CoA hydratase/carnithine racemase
MYSSSPSLHVEREGPVVRLTLNRPERLNALDVELVEALGGLLDALRHDTSVRVVVLRGAGNAFCAGVDLTDVPVESIRASVSDGLAYQKRLRDLMLAMHRCPQVFVAVLHGAASGAGFGLALAADIRIGTPQCRMNAAFIRLGVSACDMGVSYFLPRMVGTSAAAHYMLTGRFIDAQRAHQLGIVCELVEPEALEDRIEGLVQELLRATPLGLRLTKESLGFAVDMPSLESVLAMEDRNQILAIQGEDFAEGIAAFLERRKPHYLGR